MLSTRLLFGLPMVAGLLLALWVDEWFAPWFPFWFLLGAVVVIGVCAGAHRPAGRDQRRPSGNSVFGGVLAIVIANWVPHLIENHSQADGRIRAPATTPAGRSTCWPGRS